MGKVAENHNIEDIKEISAKLSTENKNYVIAVANALLFSQAQGIRAKPLGASRKKRETCGSLLT